MNKPSWQLQTPVSAIVFDCDGTLSALEGINELARQKGVYSEIESLTEKAMSETGLNPALYQKRLNLVLPTEKQVKELGQKYFQHIVPDAKEIIQLLTRLGKSIYLISAGVNPAVKIFGELLSIPQNNIFAVNLQFDQKGQFVNFDQTSPLTQNAGKRLIINQLKIKHPQIIHIGDGLNDLVVKDLVTRFIGYGGIYYRENIANQCQYYLRSPSLSALLPLVLTDAEYLLLTAKELQLYQKGCALHKEEQHGKICGSS